MYNVKERRAYFENAVRTFESSDLVEGIVQLGSGVIGYKDEHSDIDLMVATSKIEYAEITRDFISETLKSFKALYIKEKQYSNDIFLVIGIMKNGLEFNVSIVPREFLSVKSPLWKVIVDKTGLVEEKMNAENERFLSKPRKYNVGIDIPFEFCYCALALEKELKRKNFIYALKMIEELRDLTLIVQALNEDKKLHQFKAYETLDPSFIHTYLSTFPKEVTVENIRVSAERLKELFVSTVKHSSDYSIDTELEQLLTNSSKVNIS